MGVQSVEYFPYNADHLHLGDARTSKDKRANVAKRLVTFAIQSEPMYNLMVTVRRFKYMSSSETSEFTTPEADSLTPDCTTLYDDSVDAVRAFRKRMRMGLPGYVMPNYRADVG